MASQSNPSQKFVFGPFEYDSVTGDLRKHGSRIRLQGQPQRILSLLIERHDQIVSREELQQHLWQGVTFVDFDQGLNAAVNKLRQTLGDSADQPRYIETVPGRGYRFIAPLRSTQARAVLEFSSTPEVRASRRPADHSQRWLIAAVVLIVAAGAYLSEALRSGVTPQLAATRFAVTPPEGFALEGGASRQTFALSPDGTKLAFTAMDVSGAFSVFLRDFSSLESVPLANSSGAHTLFWPPDGRSLFLTVRGKLRRTPLNGDGHLELCDAPAFCFSGAWIDPSKLLIGGRRTYSVSSSGGVPESLANAFVWPQALPGGDHILYTSWDADAGRHRARIGRLDDPAFVKDLVHTDSRALYIASAVTPGKGYLLYIRAGALVSLPFDLEALRATGEATPIVDRVYSFFTTGAADFSASAKGVVAYLNYVQRSQLAWVDRQGRRLSTIGPANVNVKSARLSPDGRTLATAIYDVARGAQTLWLFDVSTGRGRQLTLAAGVRDGPVWSPDSTRLAYLLSMGSSPAVSFRDVDGADADDALPSNSYMAPTDWSPDGRFVVYTDTGMLRFQNETQGDLWLLDLVRDRKIIPLLNTSFHESTAVFSPDGNWLAFLSTESGQSEIYVQAFRGGDNPGVVGKRYPVSRSGAQVVRWSKDGKELYYLSNDGRVYAVRVSLAAEPEFAEPEALFTIGIEARAAVHSLIGFDVSSDGRLFVIPVVESGEAPSIVVIQNWESLLQTEPSS